jgi:hypothetical protein
MTNRRRPSFNTRAWSPPCCSVVLRVLRVKCLFLKTLSCIAIGSPAKVLVLPMDLTKAEQVDAHGLALAARQAFNTENTKDHGEARSCSDDKPPEAIFQHSGMVTSVLLRGPSCSPC